MPYHILHLEQSLHIRNSVEAGFLLHPLTAKEPILQRSLPPTSDPPSCKPHRKNALQGHSSWKVGAGLVGWRLAYESMIPKGLPPTFRHQKQVSTACHSPQIDGTALFWKHEKNPSSRGMFPFLPDTSYCTYYFFCSTNLKLLYPEVEISPSTHPEKATFSRPGTPQNSSHQSLRSQWRLRCKWRNKMMPKTLVPKACQLQLPMVFFWPWV